MARAIELIYARFYSKGFEKEAVLKKAKDVLNPYEFSTFSMGISYPKILSDDEKAEMKKTFQKELIELFESEFNAKYSADFADVAINVNYNTSKLEIQIKSVYLYGIYNKFSRKLPQTEYFCYHCRTKGCEKCNWTGRLATESVEQILSNHLKELFSAKKGIFHGAGREDVDVMMLGNGREFVLELILPRKRAVSGNEIEKKMIELNETEKEKVKVSSIKIADKTIVAKIKGTPHSKLYRALVECEEDIDSDLSKLTGKYAVKQRTPRRVEARRADIIRERDGEIKKIEKINNREFFAEIKAGAGLYIKEFVSGDNHRTNPSISSLLEKNCKCKQLDVIFIHR